jgi:hypothetical protein
MNPLHIAALAIATSALVNQAVAGPTSYSCTVEKVYELDGVTLRQSTWEKDFKGSRFSVSRLSGEIIGEVLSTRLAISTSVVNLGSKSDSFKSVALFEGQVQLLEVHEYRLGDSKPFFAAALGGAGIITGTCK